MLAWKKPILSCLFAGLLSAFATSVVNAAQEAAVADTAVTDRADGVCGDCGPPDGRGCGTAPGCVGESSNCGNGNRFWGSAEFLLWWIKQGQVPPLATAGTLNSGGTLGPGTTTLFGGDQDYGVRPGGRFTIGYWFDCDQTEGIEGSYFFLNGPADNFSVSSSDLPGSMLLARPFFNVISGLQDRQLISFPGIIGGSIGISSNSQLQGAELNLLCNRCYCCNECRQTTGCQTGGCETTGCQTGGCETGGSYKSGHRVDLIAGFRYFGLDEDLGITENLTFLPTAPSPPFVPGETLAVFDRFETRNTFYGGQIGARGEWWRGRWFVNVLGKVALGNMHQEVRINGTTVFTNPGGAPVSQQGGLLALPTNIGSYSRDQFAVVPEIGINVGRQLTCHLRVFAGYTFMYWSSVVRPGDQIDFGVNTTQLPTATGPGTLVGAARPAFAFHDTDFWAQGINFGMELRW